MVRGNLPELPDEKLDRYRLAFGLSEYDAVQLAADRPVAEWFDAAVAAGVGTDVKPKDLANYVLNNLFGLMNEAGVGIAEVAVTPPGLVELIELVKSKTINSSTATDVLAEMFATGRGARRIVEEKGLAQIRDTGALAAVVAQVIADNPEQVADYVGGKTKLQGWFVGQVMRATRGKADPGLVNQLLREQLSDRADNT